MGVRGDCETSAGVAKVVDGAQVAKEWWHRQVAEKVVDGTAKASGTRIGAGCGVGSVGAKGTRSESQ